MTAPSIDDLQDQLTILLDTDVTAEVMMHRQLTDGVGDSSSISLLDMRYQERVNDSVRTIRQTALLLEQDDFNFPDFTLRPKIKGLAGKLFKVLGDMSIDFEESPEFSKAYAVIGWVEPTVRELFVKPIRDHFAKDHHWSVCGHGKRLVIYQKGKVIKEKDRDAFIQKALEILSLFQLGEEALDARPDLRRETRPEDMAASSERIGGVVGAMLSKQLEKVKVTRTQMEDFALSPSPRSIPNGMSRQVIGQVGPAIAAGIFIALIGSIFGSLVLALGEGSERYIAIPCFFGTIIGLLIAFFVNRYRAGKTRILRNGALHDGTITAVKRTKTSVNNQRRHLVTIQNSKTSVECRAYGMAAKQANLMKESGDSVRFLVDPNDPGKAICLDLLTISEG